MDHESDAKITIIIGAIVMAGNLSLFPRQKNTGRFFSQYSCKV